MFFPSVRSSGGKVGAAGLGFAQGLTYGWYLPGYLCFSPRVCLQSVCAALRTARSWFTARGCAPVAWLQANSALVAPSPEIGRRPPVRLYRVLLSADLGILGVFFRAQCAASRPA